MENLFFIAWRTNGSPTTNVIDIFPSNFLKTNPFMLPIFSTYAPAQEHIGLLFPSNDCMDNHNKILGFSYYDICTNNIPHSESAFAFFLKQHC